jgi:hypothetical protein
MNFEDACNAAWARARNQCAGCHSSQDTASPNWRPHTCYGDIEAVKAVALAAAERTRIIQERRMSKAQREVVLAELDRLLGDEVHVPMSKDNKWG